MRSVMGKLGTMRKAADWTIYPVKADAPNKRIIQCDKRIAEVNLETGKAMLSDGKGGHQGFIKLSPALGAVEVDVPADMLEALKGKPVESGPVRIM